MTTLPVTPEAITPAWLDAVITDHTITDVTVDEVIAGSTTKVFVAAQRPDRDDLRLCVKGVFDDPRLPVRTLAAQQEARFFAELAPTLDMPLFRSWYAGSGQDQGIVVFDDLRDSGTTFTEVGATWSPDRVAAALEVQAAWHAATWDYPNDRFPWLVSGNQVLAAATDQLFSEEHWTRHTLDPTTVEIPSALDDRERLERAVRKLFQLQSQTVHALSHGDAHIGNTYIGADGPAFYDWQTFCLAPPLDDVTYFLAGAMTVDDRRAHERDLLQHYLSALARHGAPAPTWDDAWLAYRQYLAHGLFWAVLPPAWQPASASVPMAERYIASVLDHDTLDLLEQA